jgi:hypothetical protein
VDVVSTLHGDGVDDQDHDPEGTADHEPCELEVCLPLMQQLLRPLSRPDLPNLEVHRTP